MHRVSLAAICFAFAGGVAADSPRILHETRDDRDVAIVGDGYLRATDADEMAYFLRSCTLAEDTDGRLCASVEGKLLKLEPPIDMPSKTARMLIGACGDISVLQRGQNQFTMIGTFEVSFVRSREGMREIATGVFVCDEHVIPITDSFGERSQTFLMQGWIEGPPADETK